VAYRAVATGLGELSNTKFNSNYIIHEMDHTGVPAMIDHSIRVSSFRI